MKTKTRTRDNPGVFNKQRRNLASSSKDSKYQQWRRKSEGTKKKKAKSGSLLHTTFGV